MPFSSRDRRTLQALARAAFPTGARAPPVGESLADRTIAFLDGAPRKARLFLRAVLFAFEWAAQPGRRFSRLPEEAARRCVERWAHSRVSLVRLAFRALISPLKLVHYGEPHVARALGYDPPAETACAHPRPSSKRASTPRRAASTAARSRWPRSATGTSA